jgi:hypothetical protein
MSKAKKLAQEAVDVLATGQKPFPKICIDSGDHHGILICPTCADVIDIMTSEHGRLQCRRCRNWYVNPTHPGSTDR